MLPGQTINRGAISAIDDGRHLDAPIGTSPAWRDVIKRASLAPKYYQREQREWVDLAKRTLQELT